MYFCAGFARIAIILLHSRQKMLLAARAGTKEVGQVTGEEPPDPFDH
jgi:hypothetical protein